MYMINLANWLNHISKGMGVASTPTKTGWAKAPQRDISFKMYSSTVLEKSLEKLKVIPL